MYVLLLMNSYIQRKLASEKYAALILSICQFLFADVCVSESNENSRNFDDNSR